MRAIKQTNKDSGSSKSADRKQQQTGQPKRNDPALRGAHTLIADPYCG